MFFKAELFQSDKIYNILNILILIGTVFADRLINSQIKEKNHEFKGFSQ